jgi:hypothetical protein
LKDQVPEKSYNQRHPDRAIPSRSLPSLATSIYAFIHPSALTQKNLPDQQTCLLSASDPLLPTLTPKRLRARSSSANGKRIAGPSSSLILMCVQRPSLSHIVTRTSPLKLTGVCCCLIGWLGLYPRRTLLLHHLTRRGSTLDDGTSELNVSSGLGR